MVHVVNDTRATSESISSINLEFNISVLIAISITVGLKIGFNVIHTQVF